MPLTKCMRSHTYRQYLVWQEWLDQQWNKPSRSDHYLMQVACEVRRVLSDRPRSIELKHFKLDFEHKRVSDNNNTRNGNSNSGKSIGPITKSQAAAIAKAHWFGMMTAPIQGL